MCVEPDKNRIEKGIEIISEKAISVREAKKEEILIAITKKEEITIAFSVSSIKIESKNIVTEEELKSHFQLANLRPEMPKREIEEKIREKIRNAPCLSGMIAHFTNN